MEYLHNSSDATSNAPLNYIEATLVIFTIAGHLFEATYFPLN